MPFELAMTGKEGLEESNKWFNVYMLIVVTPDSLLTDGHVDIICHGENMNIMSLLYTSSMNI
jgi:hypothetical protein